MSESKKKILEMLESGRITAEDAYKLLSAVDANGEGANGERGGEADAGFKQANDGNPAVMTKLKPKYLRVTVTPQENADPAHADRVNVRVPMNLIRAGLKMTALIPSDALNKANEALKDKGINFDVRNIKSEDLEELITALGDMQVDVETGHGEKVKVFVEY